MIRIVARSFLVALLIGAASGVAQSGFKEGAAAIDRGDYASAFKEWQPLAEQGHVIAQYNLGQLFRAGRGVAQDNVLAAYWYRRAAERDFALAQFNLGVMYHNGDGVIQDMGEAVYWYLQAAENGHSDAQFHLGILYFNGVNQQPNQVLGAMWLEVAAKNGAGQALETLEAAREQMAADQIETASHLAHECAERQFMGC
ncbi:MAG: hypothetical protein TEF_04040 [Rhizobiales bacterium NRL2]|jgi:hypothetical protein|nr:MAG: hypothetical protein TEF_04040 [Rhizobiales bacterium NRL2]